MVLIAGFGLLLMILSIIMVLNPDAWSKGIIVFSQKSYFHPFEIISRLGFAVIFIFYANQTGFPTLMTVIGYLLVAVGLGLLVVGSNKHRQFAIWSATKFKNSFRPAGVFSLIFGAFLIYAALI